MYLQSENYEYSIDKDSNMDMDCGSFISPQAVKTFLAHAAAF